MIYHKVINPDYEYLFKEWQTFLKPFENTIQNISIIYEGQYPIFVDSENRKFQIDFENNKASYSKFKSGISSEPLSKALGSGKFGKRILDLSAGLGVDSVFLAQLGYSVTAVERNPFVFLALNNALDNLTSNYKENLKFIFDQGINFLKTHQQNYDCCYFDPMFPSKKKSALPKQEMVFFKNLVGSDDDAKDILELALKSKQFKRCVVKRPLSADPFFIDKIKPNGNIKGKIIRYDIYTN